MPRSIAYDVTHLVSRMATQALTGIDRVDLAYGRHFAAARRLVVAAYYGVRAPHVMGADTLRQIVRQAERGWREDLTLDTDRNFIRVNNWLAKPEPQPETHRVVISPTGGLADAFAAHRWYARCRYAPTRQAVPHQGIYLNIAEHWLEYPRYFTWLGSRPDIRAVFFVHDLLPLDYPEYFRPGYLALFQRRFDTMARWGTAFIVSSNVVCERLRVALAAVQRREVPIYVAPLPSPLASVGATVPAQDRCAQPYFVLVSTIEPRKNHLLVLNVWRELAAAGGNDIPRLVLIGGRGWEHEQVADMLDRCEAIRPYIFEAARLSSSGLAGLLARAQGLLMPSFDEGYGLPVVEALSLGTPVIASDIAAFREVAQGRALLLSPLDGIGWQDAIMKLSKRESSAWRAAKANAAIFLAPDWDRYFRGVEEFLDSL